MDIKRQTFLVVGVSKSGFAVANYILSNGGKCLLYEELSSPKIDDAIAKLIERGGVKVEKENIDAVLVHIDNLIISPGVPINHPVAVKAKSLGKRIIGELEFGFLQFTPTTVAITGTNGKTTTATLIDEIFKSVGTNSLLVGNVGVPITSKVCDANKDTVCVAEVSSFQLESTALFCPHVSCILNIKPDHLERHYTMENYIFLKKRIFLNQRESEYCVLNYDDEIVKSFSGETRAKVLFVSLKEKIDGAYRVDQKLYYKNEFIINQNELALKGEHNVYNSLFAIAVAKLFNLSNSDIVNVLKNFKGVKHRMEKIALKEGIEFYNDSKATNTASTISAIEGINKPIVLILGGSEKGETYIDLFEKIKKSLVKHVVLTGASRNKMLECAGAVGFNRLTLTHDFTTAVKIAKLVAEEGDCVLLSPACASFDNFSNYEERGEKFRQIVDEL